MLDTSGSMTLALDLVKLAAEEFLLRMLPEDKGKVGAFNDKLEVNPKPGCPSPTTATSSFARSAISTSATRRACSTRSTTA